jgi:hypothetical protein
VSEPNNASERIDELSRRATPPIRPAVERLQGVAAAEPPKYSPEVVEQLLAMLQAADAQVRQGASPAEAVRAATQGVAGYDQPQWQVGAVFNMLVSGGGTQETAQPVLPKQVPVVLVVMTDEEAAELLDGRAFERYPAALSEDFAAMLAILDEAAISDWAGRYHGEPREWQPFGPDGPSLSALVDATVARINDRVRYEPPLAAEFISINSVNNDRGALRRLRQDGCVVVMDSVSMRHPKVQCEFYHSMLDAYPGTSLVVMAPAANVLERARHFTVVLESRIADLEFAKRLRDPDEDYGVSLETSEQQMLEQWLATRVREMAKSLGVQPGIRPYMRIQPRDGGQ